MLTAPNRHKRLPPELDPRPPNMRSPRHSKLGGQRRCPWLALFRFANFCVALFVCLRVSFVGENAVRSVAKTAFAGPARTNAISSAIVAQSSTKRSAAMGGAAATGGGGGGSSALPGLGASAKSGGGGGGGESSDDDDFSDDDGGDSPRIAVCYACGVTDNTTANKLTCAIAQSRTGGAWRAPTPGAGGGIAELGEHIGTL